MKKFSIVAALAIAISGIFASCGNTPAKANLKNDVDTLSYAIGMAQTQGLKQYLLQMDIDTTYIDEFVKGLNDGANAGDNKKKAAYSWVCRLVSRSLTAWLRASTTKSSATTLQRQSL